MYIEAYGLRDFGEGDSNGEGLGFDFGDGSGNGGGEGYSKGIEAFKPLKYRI